MCLRGLDGYSTHLQSSYFLLVFLLHDLFPTISWPKSWQEALRGQHPHTHTPLSQGPEDPPCSPLGVDPPFPGTLRPQGVIPLLTSLGATFSLLETNYNQFSIVQLQSIFHHPWEWGGHWPRNILSHSLPAIIAKAFYNIHTLPFLDPLWLLQAMKLSGEAEGRHSRRWGI